MKTNYYPKFALFTLIFFLFFFNSSVFSQTPFLQKLYISDSLQFVSNGELVKQPFTGGMNMPVFSQVDINNDGKPDIFVYDRFDGKVLIYINTGIAGNFNYEYAPQYEHIFNDMKLNSFVLFRDFNQDGQSDLFTLEGNRLRVYMNITTQGDSEIKLRKMGDLFVKSNLGNFYNPLTGRIMDLPVIDDIDGDGDLDFITYESFSGNLELYINEQIEDSLSNDTFAFRLADMCWGGFREADNNELILGCNRAFFPTFYRRDDRGRRHATGTTLFTIDMDNDGDKELVMGNGNFQNLLFVKNGKMDFNMSYDSMISYTKSFPSNDGNEIKYKFTPAVYHFDVDGDGIKDLISAPFFFDNFDHTNSISTNNIWFLKNVGSDEYPDFQLQTKNFLMDHSIDFGLNVSPIFWDINKNGLTDLLVVVEPDTITNQGIRSSRIYRYNNIGTTKLPKFELVDSDFLNFSSLNQVGVTLTIGDVNNDGLEDIIFGNKEGNLVYLKNTSASTNAINPTFQIVSFNILGTYLGDYAAPTLFDYSLDGKLDLIIGKEDGYFSYFRNTSIGSTVSFTFVTDKFGNVRSNHFNTDLTNPAYDPLGHSAPIFFDFENDGKPELVTGSQHGNLKLWYISYDPNYPFPEVTDFYGVLNSNNDTSWGISFGSRSKVAIAKLSDSSNADILVGTGRGGFHFLSSNAIKKTVNVQTVYFETFTLSVFPNPTEGTFQISIPEELKYKKLELEIRDYTGRIIKTVPISSYNNTISLDAANGMYIGTITENGQIIGTCKIMLNR